MSLTSVCGLLHKNPTQRERYSIISLRSSQKDQGHQTQEKWEGLSQPKEPGKTWFGLNIMWLGMWWGLAELIYEVLRTVSGTYLMLKPCLLWWLEGNKGGERERITIPISKGSSWPRNQTCVSCLGRWIIYCWVTRKATPELLVFNSEIHSGIFSAQIWCFLVLSCLHLSTWRMSVLSGVSSYMNAVPCDSAQECALRIWDSWYRRDLQGHTLTLHLQETNYGGWITCPVSTVQAKSKSASSHPMLFQYILDLSRHLEKFRANKN